MPDAEDFERSFLPRFIDSLRAFHDGDPGPHIALWSTADPVTLFAIRGMREVGTEALTATFHRVAGWFSDVRDDRWELIASAVNGDSAYTVCIERRRAVHRHADRQPLEVRAAD